LTAEPTAYPLPAQTGKAAFPYDQSATDWDAVQAALRGLNLITRPAQRKQLSKDFFWYSPILSEQLADCVADLVVRVSTDEDVRQVCATAARFKLPLTVRAGGTHWP
jgi:FAD/FMN-containing dehydrogenase